MSKHEKYSNQTGSPRLSFWQTQSFRFSQSHRLVDGDTNHKDDMDFDCIHAVGRGCVENMQGVLSVGVDYIQSVCVCVCVCVKYYFIVGGRGAQETTQRDLNKANGAVQTTLKLHVRSASRAGLNQVCSSPLPRVCQCPVELYNAVMSLPAFRGRKPRDSLNESNGLFPF